MTYDSRETANFFALRHLAPRIMRPFCSLLLFELRLRITMVFHWNSRVLVGLCIAIMLVGIAQAQETAPEVSLHKEKGQPQVDEGDFSAHTACVLARFLVFDRPPEA